MRYAIKDLVDVATLQGLTDELSAATGVAAVVIAADGEILAWSGWQRICSVFHRPHAEIVRECIQSEAQVSARLEAGEAFVGCMCPRGLVDASMAVVVDGEHLATVFMGQLFTEPPDEAVEQRFREQARRFGLDEEAYMEAFREVPVVPENRFRSSVSMLAGLVRALASLELSRRREAGIAAALRVSEEKFAAAFRNAPDAALISRLEDGRIIEVNDSFCRLTGYTSEEALQITTLGLWDDPADRAVLASALQRDGAVRDMEFSFRTRDGVTLRCLYSGGLIDIGGCPHALSVVRDVTAQKATEEAIRESEGRLRSILDNMQDAYLRIDAEGRLAFVSPSAAQLYGYDSIDEMIGLPTSRLYGREEDREVLLADLARHGRVTDRVGQGRRKDGSLFGVSLNAQTFFDERGAMVGVEGVVRDITDRIQAEEALRESEERFRSIAEHSTDLIALTDLEGTIRYASRASLRLFGAEPEEMIGSRFTAFLDESAIPAAMAAFRTRAEGGQEASHLELLMRRQDGSTFLGELSGRAHHLGARPGALVTIRDITARKHAEQERLELERQLQEGQRLESLGVLAGGIAHDFNNLLTSVLGNADLALRELPPGQPARESLHEIAVAARRAADLCGQMLAYSGRGHFVVHAFDLGALVGEMVDLLRSIISKGARLDLDLGGDLPPLRGDASQLSQVVMNLVINASEALVKGEGAISIRVGATDCSQVLLDENFAGVDLAPGTYLTLEVSDDGCGMGAETQARLFEPFYTTKFLGRGLGLAAVSGIVRGHGGALRVTSKPGRGSRFTLLFPAAEGRVGPSSPKEAVEAPGWRGRGTVLLVDDEDVVRKVGTRMLRALGFEVLIAGDGLEALEVFASRGSEISLVVLDLTMPHLDGAETFRRLRHLRPGVRVVVSSGYVGDDVETRYAGQGWSGFLQKPYTLEALRDRLRAALEIPDGLPGQ